ncbi:hypothetical protein EV126DRAFT_477976 [Verticillium dahliae]|nr:hypothetical protein EV126DRAFT_477976 [Verticillium dahliae]
MMRTFSVAINCPLPAEISIKDVKRGIQRLRGTFHERVLSTTDVLCTSEGHDRDSQHTRLQLGRQGGFIVSLDWLQDSFTAGRFLDPLEYPISQETWALRGEDEENSEKEIEEASGEEIEEESEEDKRESESEAQRVEYCRNIAVLLGIFRFLLMKAVEKETEGESDAQRVKCIDIINDSFRCLHALFSTAVKEEKGSESEAEVEEDSEESEEETTPARFDPRRPLYNCGIVIADKSSYLTQAQLEEEVGHLGGVLLPTVFSCFPKVSFVNHDWLDACSQQGSLVDVGPYIHDRLDEEESEESEEKDREEDEEESEGTGNSNYDPRERRS